MDQFQIVSQPKRMKVSLYKHQLTSIYNMEKLEYNAKINVDNLEEIKTRIGILSDLTGYGKTLSVLGLIERDKMIINKDEPFIVTKYYGNDLICKKKVYLYDILDSTLIVVNPSLFCQWENELNKTDINFGLVNSKKMVDDIQPQNHEIILCNSNMVGHLIARFRKFCWKRLIIDEPLSFKITDYNNFAFGFIWLITATPFELVNNKKGLNYIYNELFSGNEILLRNVIIRNPDEYVKSSFNMPENIHIKYYCYDPMSKILKDLVSPIIYEMITAGNITEAIKMLGGEEKSCCSLYNLIKDKKQKKIKELDMQILINENKDSKLKLLNRKKELENQIELLDKRLNELLNENCIVCYSSLNDPVFLPCCQNIICGSCILTWLKTNKTCPLCRCVVEVKNLIIISKDVKDEEKSQTQRKTKPQTVLDIVKKNKEGKFIIFSNYDESFNTLQILFGDEGVSYTEIKGNKDSRNKNILNYKTGNVQVLFLNSKNNAAGINLEETTDIILYHKMSEYGETQILGRANRIGRKNKLSVHHLI